MHKLYITALSESTPAGQCLNVLREACAPWKSLDPVEALRLLNQPLPILVAEDESEDALTAAETALSAVGFEIRCLGPDESISSLESIYEPIGSENQSNEPEDMIAQIALVLLNVANANPVLAVATAASLAHVMGESDPGFFEAGILLARTFPAAPQGDLVRAMIDAALDMSDDEHLD